MLIEAHGFILVGPTLPLSNSLSSRVDVERRVEAVGAAGMSRAPFQQQQPSWILSATLTRIHPTKKTIPYPHPYTPRFPLPLWRGAELRLKPPHRRPNRIPSINREISLILEWRLQFLGGTSPNESERSWIRYPPGFSNRNMIPLLLPLLVFFSDHLCCSSAHNSWKSCCVAAD